VLIARARLPGARARQPAADDVWRLTRPKGGSLQRMEAAAEAAERARLLRLELEMLAAEPLETR
jgi:hypothetical protein